MKKTLLCSALLAALMSVTGGAQASLVSQGAGLVLDNVNNLLWFTDSTNRNFDGATSWAADLTTGGLSAGSWSITSRDQFNLLAEAAGGSSSEKNATLLALGIPGGYFWTSTVKSAAVSYCDGPLCIDLSQLQYLARNASYSVDTNGVSGVAETGFGSLAVAAYTAPAPSAVPIPAAAWLMASGLGAFGAAARKRKAQAA
jgi:hypothetical protein